MGEEVYDRMATVFETHAATSPWNAHYDRPAVLDLAGDVAGLRVLDAACGPGLYAEALAGAGATVTAFDASEPMLELARKRLDGRAEVLHADFDEPLPFADGAFDLVVCALAIHYATDRTATLRELRRVLRPGGAAVLSTQHPTMDWLRKGGSYFEVRREVDVWRIDGGPYDVPFWREPLTALCAAIADAGFLIERLVEPQPAPSMRQVDPDAFEQLRSEPGFLVLRLLHPPHNGDGR